MAGDGGTSSPEPNAMVYKSLDQVVEALPYKTKLHEHPDPHVQASAAKQIANINLISKPETYGGDLLRKVLRGLLFMLSGKGTSQEPLRRESQRLAARALSWLCWVAEVPGILLEKPADGAVGFLSGMRTIAQCLHESNDRAVLVEVTALVGWLASSSDENALKIGEEETIMVKLGDLLSWRMSNVRVKAAWALACLARGKNKSLILSGESLQRVTRALTEMLRSKTSDKAGDMESQAIAARLAGCLASGNRANGAIMARSSGGKASELYLALKVLNQSTSGDVRLESGWAEQMLLASEAS